MSNNIDQLLSENEQLHEELITRDAEIKNVVLAIVQTANKLGIDFEKMKANPMQHLVTSGLLMKLTTGQLDIKSIQTDFAFIGELVEKYKYLVEDEIKLING
jgi:hypothetical protein